MKKNNAVAPMYRPAQTYAPNTETIAIPQSDARTQRERVVSASNQSVPVPIALIMLGVFAIASIAIGYFGGDAVGVSIPVRIVFSGALMLIMALITMAFITGDAAALFESWQGERTERKALDVEEVRIDALKDVTLADYELKSQESNNNHEERMAQIEADTLTHRYYLEDANAHNHDNYVPNHPDLAKKAVRAFLKKCYTTDGYNIPDYINGQGGGLTRSPWTGAWKGKEWAGDARAMMIEYVLDPVGEHDPPKQWRLRYPTNAEAQQAIPKHG